MSKHQTERQPLNNKQIVLVREYLAYYIHAPCWAAGQEEAATFAQLRECAPKLQTGDEIAAWLRQTVSFGIDPL